MTTIKLSSFVAAISAALLSPPTLYEGVKYVSRWGKKPLTPRQQRLRSASKRARKARRINRERR